MASSEWSEELSHRERVMPIRRSRSSRRDRNRKAEDDAQQRLTGDAHWSKLLQVNPSEEDMRLVRRLSSKKVKKDKEEKDEKERNEKEERERREKEKERSREPSRERPGPATGGKANNDGGSSSSGSDNGGSRGGGGSGGGGGGGLFSGGGGGCFEGGFINSCSSEGTCSVRVISPRPRHGLLSAITSRLRLWLGSRRKDEISPRDCSYLRTSPTVSDLPASKSAEKVSLAATAAAAAAADWEKDPPGLVCDPSSVFYEAASSAADVDAALNRCGAGRLSPRLQQPSLPNGYAAATAAESGKIPLQRSPVSHRDHSRVLSPTTPSKGGGSVLSMLTAVIANSALAGSVVGKASKDSKDASKGARDAKDPKAPRDSGRATKDTKDLVKASTLKESDQTASDAAGGRTDLGGDGGAGGSSRTPGVGEKGSGLAGLASMAGGRLGLGLGKAKGRNPVDIRIEVVDMSGHSPSPLSPSASRLLASSRRHLLRQSRSKLKDRVTSLVTSLVPTVPTATSLMHQPLTTTISCPPQSEAVASLILTDPLSLRRCHSWPLPRRKAFPEDEECPDSAKEEALESAGLNGQESLDDCSIRFDDLELGECIRVGRRCRIYRARWHGDVYVHLFGELVKRPDREGFWRDVAKLCRIRHENINLFMGACTVAPNLAVITSHLTGKSLYEHIHVQREKMTLHTRVQILQGVAQGMGYLHAKGIVLRKLNTANIFLCPRVKVSAIDFSIPEARHNRKDYASIPRCHLTYVAPELMSTLRVIPPRLVPTVAPSPETDVFAFGTIMYEVLGGSYPYPSFPPESVIWSVCSGHRQNLNNVNCTMPLKGLIEDCWSHEPLYRPDFPELSKELHRNSPQYKRHSSSEPERLNRSPGVLD